MSGEIKDYDSVTEPGNRMEQSQSGTTVQSTHLVETDDLAWVPLEAARAEGAHVWDQNGTEYLDFFPSGGAGVLGYQPKDIVCAIQDQAQSLHALHSPHRDRLEEAFRQQLSERSEGGWVALMYESSAAVDWALRWARLRSNGQRYKVISFVGSQHGTSLGAISVSGDPHLQEGLGPLVAGSQYCAYGDIEGVQSAIDDLTGAILVQPAQVGAGFHLPDDGFLEALRQLADHHDLALLFDESELPIGATGHWFAYQHFNVQPDGLILSSGLGAGLPLAAVVVRQAMQDQHSLPNHCSLATPPISPVITAAATAVLEAIDANGLLARVLTIADPFAQQLGSLEEDFDFVRQVRSLGLSFGVELDVPLAPFLTGLQRRGLLVGHCGDNVLRLQPPLNIEDNQLQDGFQILRATFESIERQTLST